MVHEDYIFPTTIAYAQTWRKEDVFSNLNPHLQNTDRAMLAFFKVEFKLALKRNIS